MKQPDPRRYTKMAPRPPEGTVDIHAIFGGDIELDVGFGRGLSVFTRAEAAPDARILGVEVKTKCVYKVDQELQRMGVQDRVKVWAWDIRELVQRMQPDGCVTRAYLHFPDPWWKERHQKRRVLTSPWLDSLARVMPVGGELYVQTDVDERHELYVATCEEHPAFEMVDAELTENPFGGISNRERRAAEDGLPVRRMLARRV